MSLVPAPHSSIPAYGKNELGQTIPNHAQGVPQPPAFDLWGALARRKFIVLLSCLIAGAFGYLDYKRQPKQFASSTRLMITTQSPPQLVNGDFAIPRESMPRHTNLLTSQVVIASAIENGDLGKLDSFKDVPFPISQLSSMISVNSLSRNDDTLMIRCEGSNPEDLPIILNQLVHAYEEIITEDSETVGKDSIELIEKLGEQLKLDKDGLAQKYLELIRTRGLSEGAAGEQIENPFLSRSKELLARHSELNEKLKQQQYRAKILADTINANDEHQMKIAAIEAKTYLGLNRSNYLANQTANVDHRDQSNRLNLISAAESRIANLQFERAKLSRVFGKGHNTIVNINSQIAYWNDYVGSLRRELSVEVDNRQDEEKTSPIDMRELRRQEDAEWILLYKMALTRDINRVKFEMISIDAEREIVDKNAANISQDVAELNMLKKQIEEKSEANRVIIDRLSEINVLANNYTRTKVRVLDPPVNGYKIAPILSKSLGVALFLGSVIGMGLALLIDRSDMSFRSPFEILDRLKIPVVGKIPRIRTLRKEKPAKGVPQLIVANRPGSSVAEAFRDIRTAMFFRSNADDVKTILFTSPSPGDGKSTTVSNLAISIAQTGKSVVLVDADFRRPRIYQYFGEELEPGLLNVLDGDFELDTALCESELQPGLFLLNAGGRPRNPGEIVTSPGFSDIIHSLRETFDYVLIDSPPVLPVADPATIAGIVDGVYLIVRIRKGVKLTTQKAKENLDRVDPNWMGIIVNGLDENPHYNEYNSNPYYANYHGRYYDSQNAEYREKIVKG